MKKVTFQIMTFAVLGAGFLTACAPKAKEEATEVAAISGTFNVDTDSSKIQWFGKKVTGEHNGTVKLKEGSFVVEKGALSSGTATIDLTTIVVIDLTDPEWNGKLKGHLESPDFFNIAEFPTASLTFQKGENGLAGDLTIKGITKPAKFDAQVSEENGKAVVSGTLTVDRTAYDIRYGSGKFFENLGDKTISDEFSLKFKVVAK